jgi:hypothetical protein
MPVYNRLTDRQQVSAVTLNDIIHVVVTGDTSQSPQGSSYFAPLSDIQAILSGSTGPSGTNGTSGSSGSSVRQELQELQELQVLREQVVHLVLMGLLEPQVRMELQVLPELQVFHLVLREQVV